MTKSKNYATKNIRTRYSTLKKKNRITFIKITLWNISYRSRNEQEIDRERERERGGGVLPTRKLWETVSAGCAY